MGNPFCKGTMIPRDLGVASCNRHTGTPTVSKNVETPLVGSLFPVASRWHGGCHQVDQVIVITVVLYVAV
jgi:hypothetical protein